MQFALLFTLLFALLRMPCALADDGADVTDADKISPVPMDTFEFVAVADTYIDASNPDSNFGTTTGLWVDGSPSNINFFKFQISGLDDRAIVGARLRLYNRDFSPFGGRVIPTDANWEELSVTWNTRPDISGQPVAAFGPVDADSWYELELGPVTADNSGFVSFAIDSDNSNAARWGSREFIRLPRLLVDVEHAPDKILDGITQIAHPDIGSSDPTSRAGQHRLGLTSGGRQLVVHGRHAQGVQLAWRDEAGGWRTGSRGDELDGLLIGDTGTGDWTASIGVASDSSGAEHAWIVYSSQQSSRLQPVLMRRLSDLDHPGGPFIGPQVTVSAAAVNLSADLAFEAGIESGLWRGCLTWIQRNAGNQFEVVTAWFSDLSSDTPVVDSTAILMAGMTDGERSATLVPNDSGMRLLINNGSGNLHIFTHNASEALSAWQPGAAINAGNGIYPSAVALASGEILAAVETDTGSHETKIFLFAADGGSVSVDGMLSGYRQPALTTDGFETWLVAVRNADGWVISRARGNGWEENTDIEEMAPLEPLNDGIDYRWPNPFGNITDGRLRFVVEGPPNTGPRSSVFAYQRPEPAAEPVNAAPVAASDSYVTDEDTPLNVSAPGVLRNDSDADGDPLTVTGVTGPGRGSLMLNADGSFIYTPDAGFSGTDSFTYKANDARADSNTATVTIRVNSFLLFLDSFE